MYVIAGLLAILIAESVVLKITLVKLDKTELALQSCKEANIENEKTIGILQAEKITNAQTCSNQIKLIRDAQDELEKKQGETSSLLDDARKRLKNEKSTTGSLLTQVNNLESSNKRLKQQQPVKRELTDAEAKEIVEYWDGFMPRSIEQQLRIRNQVQDGVRNPP